MVKAPMLSKLANGSDETKINLPETRFGKTKKGPEARSVAVASATNRRQWAWDIKDRRGDPAGPNAVSDPAAGLWRSLGSSTTPLERRGPAVFREDI